MKTSVSVIIPCFNAEATILDALTSVIAQSEHAFEIIVIDDGSTDRTIDIVCDIAKQYPLITLQAQKNSGPSAARNAGVAAAAGDLIAFLDADDKWAPCHIAVHIQQFVLDPRLDVSFSQSEYIDKNGTKLGSRSRPIARRILPEEFLYSNPSTTCSALVVRKAAWQFAGPMRETQKFAEDQEWLFRGAAKGLLVRGVGVPTVFYRISSRGLSSQTASMMCGWEDFIREAEHMMPDLIVEHRDNALAAMQLYCCGQAWRTRGALRNAVCHFREAVRASPQSVAHMLWTLIKRTVSRQCIRVLPSNRTGAATQ